MDGSVTVLARLGRWRLAAKRVLGRRGTALVVFGTLDLAVAWSLLSPPDRIAAHATPGYRALVLWMPLTAWAALWGAVGVLCLVQAFMRKDLWGFGAAIGVKLMWTSGMVSAWVLYREPRVWLSAIVWAGLAVLVSVIAGWPEPIEPTGE